MQSTSRSTAAYETFNSCESEHHSLEDIMDIVRNSEFKEYRLLVITFFMHIVLVASLQEERQLITQLLHENKYSKDSRPVLNSLHTVQVHMGIALREIVSLNEKNQILTSSIWIRQYWFDQYLRWNVAEYAGVKRIHISMEHHWKPDIILFNNAVERFTPTFFDIQTPIRHDGLVKFMYPAVVQTSCTPDVKYFPFDQQVCQLEFMSWAFDSSSLNLSLQEENAADTQSYRWNSEWALVGMEGRRREASYGDEAGITYPSLHFYITIRRRPAQYIFYLVFPNILINIITIVQFWLPCDSGERVSLGITVVLSMVVYLLLLQEMLPMSEQMPLIGSYFAATTVWATLSLLLTFIVLYIHHRDAKRPVPLWCKNVFLNFLGRILCVQKYKEEEAIPGSRYSVDIRRAPSKLSRHRSTLKSQRCDSENDAFEYSENVDNVYTINGAQGFQRQESAECILLTKVVEKLDRLYKGAKRPQTEWQELAMVVHRLLFWLYLSTIVITCSIIFFSRPAYDQPVIK